jgi:very-short-patch-repair endonuclease
MARPSPGATRHPLPSAGEGCDANVPSPATRERARERAAPKARMASATPRTLLKNAKNLRSHQTDAEQRLWYHLRAHRFLGLKFKRQKPIGPYIADFICESHRLAIEVDGGQHNEHEAYDKRRTAYLQGKGYRVLRFWNTDVLKNADAVLGAIRLAVGEAALSPTPLPQAGEGKASH